MKPLLNALGLPGGAVRLPRLAISDEELADVLDATLKLNIAELPRRTESAS
jgi:dihydrodipicolinate synthase/N-acetylneuraminate lyase